MSTTDTNIDVIVREIWDGTKDLNALDFTLKENCQIAEECLKQHNILAKKLDSSDPIQCKILENWVRGNYRNLLLLDPVQLNHSLVDAYLERKFADIKLENDKVSVGKSYSNQQVISYEYETHEGEQVCYFDKSLGMPTSLIAQISLKIKIINALALVEKIDIEISRVDLAVVVGFIHNSVTDTLREITSQLIEKGHLNYYDLNRMYIDIGKLLVSALNAKLSACGLQISDLRIRSIEIPNNTGEMLEKQYFALSEQERIRMHEYKMEAESLKLYEAKAAIHNKYPQFPITLTEAEKDLALNRYLKRLGKDKELSADIKSQTLKPAIIGTDGTRSAKPQIIEKEPQKPKVSFKFRTGYIILAILAVLASVAVAVFVHLIAGIAMLVGFGAILIGVGVGKRDLLRYGMKKSDLEAYQISYDSYRRHMEEAGNNAPQKAAAVAEETSKSAVQESNEEMVAATEVSEETAVTEE